jgi:signal transduction histidine kinase
MKSASSHNSHPSSLSFFSKNEILIKYTLVPSIPLLVIAILSADPDTWRSSEIHHFYIEMFAVILAAILSFYYMARARTLNDKFSLFLGIGFLANALIDLLHVIVSYNLINEPLFLKYFIPQTWFAGRLFLSAMFAMAIAGYPILSRKEDSSTNTLSTASSSLSRKTTRVQQLSPSISEQDRKEEEEQKRKERESRHNKLQQKTLVVSLAVLAGVAAISAISSLFVVFPAVVLDNYPLHRPYEIAPLVLLLVALFYFYKNQLYKKSDVFYKGILGAIVIDVFAQIIISYSSVSFDTAHNVAHILKDAAYFVNIIGLALSSINYNLRLKESNTSLEESNASLMAKEELIRTQYERLKESDKMKNEFINVASHELRTPIQPIISLSALLRPKIQDIQQRELLDVITRNAKRLLQLTEAILDVTKIESQSLILKKELFNLNDVIINALNDTTLGVEFLNNKNIQLLYKPQDILLEADKGRITQVISNLLSNAIKFTKIGTVTISVNSETRIHKSSNYETVLVSVKDTGEGVNPDVLSQLFTKFATKSPLHGTQTGTGLGLFISKSIIETHGGKIWVENNIDGNGATFSFSLPTSKKQQVN